MKESLKPWARRLVGVLIVWIALWAVAWLAVPPLVRSQGERLGGEALGRKVSIARVDFAPWTLELTLHQVAVATADGQGVQLALERVRIDADLQSLIRFAPVLDALEIDKPVLHLAQTGPGQYDIDDILARWTAPQDGPPATNSQRFALYNIALRGGSVDVQDHTVQQTHTLRGVELSIPFLSNLPSQREVKVQPRLAFELNGSAFDSSAQATPFLDSRKTEAQLRLKDFDLTPWGAYLPKDLPFTLQSGKLDVDVQIGFVQQPEVSVHVRGAVQARGLRLQDRAGQQTLLDLEEAAIEIADLEPLAQRARLQSFGASVRALALGGWQGQAATAPRLGGRLDADGDVSWSAKASHAQVSRLTMKDLALYCPPPAQCAAAGLPGVVMRDKSHLAQIQALQIDKLRADALGRSLQVERVTVTQPQAMVERDKEGRWMFEHWLGSPMVQPAVPAPSSHLAPWDIRLGVLEIEEGALALRDSQPQRPVSLTVAGLHLRWADFAPLSDKPAPVELQARIGTNRSEPGRLEYTGQLAFLPLATQGRVLAQRLPLHALEPYVSQALNVRVLRADGSFQGAVQYQDLAAGPVLQVQGDVSVDDLRVRSSLLTRPATAPQDSGARKLDLQDDLLHWKTLGLRGVDIALRPGKAPRIEVRETALSDFFARLIVQENGRINLQDVLKPAAALEQQPAKAVPTVAEPAASAVDLAPAVAQQAWESVATNAPVVRFGPVALTGGAVRFSDYFIKPNYSADLSELVGRLGAFASDAPQGGGALALADLELRGRAEGTAQLEIVGKINPLAHPLALQIEGHMRDLELPPLSPYAVKYAGHGIERGKLNMDVSYTIDSNGQLTANNKLVLRQLTFGEPVEGAPANLPVRLAVALLADRNGVIDLDLPISGSLNDPQFRLGSVVIKILGNLIAKAVTAPFSLLAGALGGAGDLSTVAFAPGLAQLDDAARQGLDKVAQALADRPALTLTVSGQAQLAVDREGWKRAHLQKLLLAQKRREAGRNGQNTASVTAVTADETPALLKEVYLRAEIPKPRNLVGIAKELSQAEMQALLLANIAVPDDAMRELAAARAVAVRDYLLAHKAPPDRLFMGAANTTATQADWTPRAELSLAMK